jgi:hypothetical protein
MSSREDDLESAQKDQKNIGKASSDPETAGPTKNLREEAAEIGRTRMAIKEVLERS